MARFQDCPVCGADITSREPDAALQGGQLVLLVLCSETSLQCTTQPSASLLVASAHAELQGAHFAVLGPVTGCLECGLPLHGVFPGPHLSCQITAQSDLEFHSPFITTLMLKRDMRQGKQALLCTALRAVEGSSAAIDAAL